MIKYLLPLLLFAVTPAFSQTPIAAPQVLGCTNPASAVPPAPTVWLSSGCKTPSFLPLSTTSVLASVSKTTPVWAHTYTGYAATDLLVACPIGAIVSGASCTLNGADVSALIAQGNVATFTAVPSTTAATVTWTPPTQNTDGSPLTDLASFNVWQGSISVGSVPVGTTSYKLNSLTVGSSYTFSVSAVNAAGAESDKATITQTITLSKTPGAPLGVTITVPAK